MTARRKPHLTLVVPTRAPRKYECLLHLKSQRPYPIPTRRTYSSLDSAIEKATTWARRMGRGGDVFEVVHMDTKKQLGTIRITATGRLSTWWLHEEEL